MFREGINGFCMALADSVPGVSGGTIAFVMGFYDRLIGSIHDLAFEGKEKKKESLFYLCRLGIGWVSGMVLAVIVLSALFESHIYLVSSLFFGFVLASVPLIVKEETDCLKKSRKSFIFCLIGLAVVVGMTMANGNSGGVSMDLGQFSIWTAGKLFLIGMTAVSAMFLPGISGSTLLLIFGAYIPVITAVKGVLSLDFSYIPCLLFFGCGVLAGALSVVKAIKASPVIGDVPVIRSILPAELQKKNASELAAEQAAADAEAQAQADAEKAAEEQAAADAEAEAQAAADAALQDYVDAYSAMKPKDAANVFDSMIPDQTDLVVKILENLTPDQRAAILGKMGVANAAEVTVRMEQ